jgi:hypothetical protein
VNNNVAIRLTPVEVLPEPHYGSYCTRFVRPYLGGLVYDLLVILQETAHDRHPPSINELVTYMGYGLRHTILGRKASPRKSAQEGLVDKAVKVGWLIVQTSGSGRETSHVFNVIERFPVLSHAQVATLPAWLQEQHYLFVQNVEATTLGIRDLFARAELPDLGKGTAD